VTHEATPEKSGARIVASAVRIALWSVAAIAVALAVAAGVALYSTSQPSYFARYGDLTRRYVTMSTSAHRGIACVTCHTDPRGPLATAVDRVGLFYGSLTTTSLVPAFLTFAPPSNDACLQCHRYDWSNTAATIAKVPHPAHYRVATETRQCVMCHKWVAHEEPYQAKHTTMPFSGVCASFPCHVGTKQPADCANCHHVLQTGPGGWLANHPNVVRANGPDACLESCHKIQQCQDCHTTGKTPTLPSSTPTAAVTTIESLHVQPDWLTIHGTVALQDPAKCQTCHISEGECQDCHSQRPAFHGSPTTWLVRHQTYGVDRQRCLECHQATFCDDCHAQFKETH
jgi:hypothetical protein